jgi:hypothetical protein
MPELTRRRDPDALQETWLIYFGDVHVGTIMRSVGNRNAAPQWQWRCGFYPGSNPGECKAGTSLTFGQARADFDAKAPRLPPKNEWLLEKLGLTHKRTYDG